MRQALKLALEALSPIAYNTTDDPRGQAYKAITAIKEALAQPEQEPVAIVDANDEGYWADILPDRNVKVGQFLYTTPPQRTWVGLTDDEIFEIHKQVDSMQYLTFGHAIEAKLKDKNT